MKIKKIRSWTQDLGNMRPYVIAFKTIGEVRNVFFEVELENGMRGIGSSNPSKYVVGESLEDSEALLSSDKMSFLIGRDIREFNALFDDINEKFPANPASRAAIDIAIHDVFTQYLGIPLWKFLGRKIKKLATSVTIGIKDVQGTLEETDEYVGMGFNVIKVKLGHDVDLDIERLAKMREKYGDNIIIRIDANQGYTVDSLIHFYEKTLPYKLELIEQPIKADAIDEMKKLPLEIRNHIAADESLINPEDAFKLLDGTRACGIFNIKMMKCGGIFQGRRIGSIALASGTDLMWGCNDESMVSITAALHTAYSFSNTKYIDLDGSLDLVDDIVSGGFTVNDGYLEPVDKPGLGLTRL